MKTLLTYILLQDHHILFASEKIYTVLAVILVIWFAFIAYLFITNRKISRLEEEFKMLKTEKNSDGKSV